MSFGPEDDELDWGDVVDVVSLGDEDEIPSMAAARENIGEETVPIHSAQEEDFEPATMSAKSPLVAAFSHPLGLSHLPPKPQPALHHRRSRETIKASSMSRTYNRASSPGSTEDLPRHWEVRRTETVIYYYHTEHRCSQLKRPTRDDVRLDKFHWKGDEPPSSSGRSQSARNPSSGPAEWPERSAPDQQQNRASARDKSPSRRSSPPPPPPPRQRSPNSSRMRSNSSQQPAPARAMSPSSMLLPRRGASPARGLAKTGNKPQRVEQDVSISSETQDSRSGRSRDSGWEQRGRNNGRERDNTRNNGRTDHYSPPPEVGDTPPRRGSRHRSISPHRKAPMRSDAMIINQHSRRSLSPRDRDDGRGYERAPFERMPSDARYGREYPIDIRRAGEYHDPREDRFRTTNGRAPNPFPPGPEAVSPRPRDSASFSPHTDDAGYPAPPPAKFREAPFGARPENRRGQSSRSVNVNVRSARVESQEGDARISPVALRNEVPLPPRHEFAPQRDGTSSHRRDRNGSIRGRMIPEDRVPSMEHEPIPPSHVERDRHPDIRQDGRIRRHGHRHSVSGEDYLPSHSPQATRERDLPDVSPPMHPYAGRPHDFSPQDLAESREPDFRPRDREPEHYPPKERRDQHEPYPHGLRQDDPIPHNYDAPPAPHARRIVQRDSETLPPGRVYPSTEPQGPPSPAPPVREAYPRRYVRDDQFTDRPSRGWEREDEGPASSEEARHVGSKSQQGARRVQREVASDPEYIEPRNDNRSNRRARGSSRFDKPETEGRPSFKRRPTRDDNQAYEPEDRQWTPRDAPPPLARARSPVAQMEVDPPHVSLPEKQLAGWANFHRRREWSQEHREPYRPRPGVRDSWHPAPNEDQDIEIEGSKRQRIEDGARPTQSFNHREEDLPRKIPQHSPSQRQKMHSPNNSLSKLPPPVLVIQPAVDFQAAVTRAKDVASQLTQANPQHKSRPKSRFDQLSEPTRDREMNRELLVPNGSSGAFGGVNASETVTPETNERSSPEVVNDGRQGSEGSHSSHIVSRMDEASLRDNVYPQRHPERHRDSRPDNNGPPRRDRNRSENHRNGGRNNGEKPSRFIDSYRPSDENPGRGAGGMRAWGKSETEPQRDAPPPPHTSALSSTNRPQKVFLPVLQLRQSSCMVPPEIADKRPDRFVRRQGKEVDLTTPP
ncbi:unnamed protein product [Rhizoctonia solani]|uniref:Uncharacterized protein n=1 Tax=Rhizoctonia solani TaxID=456999 RepID=A0A8H2X6X0_9AGAM|nr:unnamed protein product [Rhizoctonia solani]